MHIRLSSLLLISAILFSSISLAFAYETRYCRNDLIFGSTQSSTNTEHQESNAGSRVVYYYAYVSHGGDIIPPRTLLFSRTSNGEGYQTASLSVPNSESNAIVQFAVEMRIYSTYFAKDKFNTSELLHIDASNWNVTLWTKRYYDPDEGYTYGYFRYGSSTYNSRVENISFHPAVTAAWNTVSIWSIFLVTRSWQTSATWTDFLTTRAWNTAASWSNYLVTMSWKTVGSWSNFLISRTWQNVATWSITLLTPRWNTVATWSILLLGEDPTNIIVILFLFSVVAFTCFGLYRRKKKD